MNIALEERLKSEIQLTLTACSVAQACDAGKCEPGSAVSSLQVSIPLLTGPCPIAQPEGA